MNYRLLLAGALLMGTYFQGTAQQPDPVHFNFTASKTTGNGVEIHIVANIDQGWHIYAQQQPEEAIATPTAITFSKNPLVAFAPGKLKEVGHKEKYTDKAAGIVQYQYAQKVEFVQPITVKGKGKTTVNGNITYQVCTDEMCLPSKTVPFRVSLPG